MWERVYLLEQLIRPYIPFTALNTVWRLLDKKASSLLDVGCGRGTPARFLRAKRHLLTIGVDIYMPYINEAKSKFSHDEYVRGDVRSLPFRPKSFDVVLAMEVLEHLDKEEGAALLKSMEGIARHQVIITSPVGVHAQETLDGNPHQKHKHIWQPGELVQLGYKVRGHGLRNLGGRSGIQSSIPKAFRPLIDIIWILAGMITYFRPSFSGSMVCIKKVE